MVTPQPIAGRSPADRRLEATNPTLKQRLCFFA
jgi:hypothetical protein